MVGKMREGGQVRPVGRDLRVGQRPRGREEMGVRMSLMRAMSRGARMREVRAKEAAMVVSAVRGCSAVVMLLRSKSGWPRRVERRVLV